MPTVDLDRARAAYQQEKWADAADLLAAADEAAGLEIADLERLAEVSQILGRGAQAAQALQRAYQHHVDAGRPADAMRCAFWLHEVLVFRGEFAHAGGWLARAQRLTETEPHCAQRGYLLLPEADRQLSEGSYQTAYQLATEAAELGTLCGDVDLTTVATHLQGRALVRQGHIEDGITLLDEAMVGIAAGETSCRVTGWIYCSTIATCQELHEVRRAREWTTALNAWCESLPQFTGAYSGICRIHRSELLQLSGRWPDAAREAQAACELLTQGYGEVVAGNAFYQLAEVHRLRGHFTEADETYRRASQHGFDTQPGLALLRLAQGRRDAAVSGIRRALAETDEQIPRSRLLPAYVEIMLAVDDGTAAREAATELAGIAEEHDTVALRARAAYARGAVHLADGAGHAALPALRQAWRLWRELDVPYEAARVRELVGCACRTVGDDDTSAMEFDAARLAYQQLGAAADLRRIEALIRKPGPADPAGLSPRELEVLRLVAAGKTNQAIAAELFLSEKTVARHVSNILTKLGVASRTAATGYAYEHGLS